jgi:enoyl-CoA hydratase
MFFSGEPAPLDWLLRLGAVLEVVPRDRLLETARHRATQITRHGGVALRIGKRTLNHIEAMELKVGYEFEQGRTGQLSGYGDSREARKAALEGRPAHYEDSIDDLRRAIEAALQ